MYGCFGKIFIFQLHFQLNNLIKYFLKCGSTGQVIGIENNSKIIRLARENVKQDECFQGEMCAPAFFPSNPTNGCVMESPFNAIHLGGALTEIPQTVTSVNLFFYCIMN